MQGNIEFVPFPEEVGINGIFCCCFYSQSIENLLQRLTTVYEGTEGTDGWITVGNIK